MSTLAATRTVVIVDDHPSFRAAAGAVLAADGFNVVAEAVDGQTALEVIASTHPDVVLLDVQLPDVDGFAVAAALAARGDGPAVILTSSRDGCDYGSLLAECGAVGFVPKSDLSGAALRDLVAPPAAA